MLLKAVWDNSMARTSISDSLGGARIAGGYDYGALGEQYSTHSISVGKSKSQSMPSHSV